MATNKETDSRKSKRRFIVKGVFPETLTAKDLIAKEQLMIDLGHDVAEQYIGKREVDIQFDSKEPVAILLAGDLHTPAIATNQEKVRELREYIINTSNVYVFLTGDMIEGVKMAYLHTNVKGSPLTFTQQLDFFRESFLRPIYEAGKVLGMVVDYTGHEGWTEAAETINSWRILSQGMDIVHIGQGGIVRLGFPRSKPIVFQMFHNPPGRSQFDPIHGLRMKMLSSSIPIRPDVITAADIHRAGIGQDIFAGSIFANPATYIQGGTPKGSDKKHHDILGINWALPQAEPGIPAAMIRPTRDGERGKKIVPVMDFSSTSPYLTAMKLLDRAYQDGTVDELKEKIYENLGRQPRRVFMESNSIVDSSSFTEKPSAKQRHANKKKARNGGRKQSLVGKSETEQYEKISYNIVTKLPVIVHFPSNAALGGEYEGAADIRKYIRKFINTNPYAFVLFLRNNLDRSVATSYERKDTLQRYIDLINLTGKQGLGVLFDAAMHHRSWLQDLGSEWGSRLTAVAPGNEIINQTHLPLIRHGSRINLRVGPSRNARANIRYPGVAVDKLGNHGSQSKATFGQQRMYQLYQNAVEKPSWIVGGHMPNAGVSRWFDPTNQFDQYPAAIAPGFFSKYTDEMGLGNLKPGAKPGQALILMPGLASKEPAMMIPTVNRDETDWLYLAMFLYSGLSQLGLVDKVLKKTK